MQQNTQLAEQDLKSLKTFTLITYVLYFVGAISGGICTLIGLILAYVKRGSATGTIYHSHFSHLIKTFWIGLILSIISLFLVYFGIGLIALIIVGIWYLYRLIIGVVKLVDNKEI